MSSEGDDSAGGEVAVDSPPGRLASIGRVAAAVLVLMGVWLFAVEAWRVRWPAMLVAFVVVGWPLAVAAWRPVLPHGWRWSLALAAVLVWGDLFLDWWLDLPSDRELAAPQWEAAKVALLMLASLAVERLPVRPARRRVTTLVIALSSTFTVLLVGLILFVAIAGTRDQTGRADAALVLGYALANDGSPRPNLIARVDRAAELYKGGLAPHLVLSGGAERAGRTEAGVMRELLLARGVPTEAIKLDTHARSTEENFACSVPILAELRARRVLVVTESWHMPRALYQASRYRGGLELLAAPASSPDQARSRSQRLVTEAVAYLFERVRRISGDPVTCP